MDVQSTILQIMNDLQAVLHRQGWPRNDIEIVMERMMASMPPDVKGNAKKQVDWLTEQANRLCLTPLNPIPTTSILTMLKST